MRHALFLSKFDWSTQSGKNSASDVCVLSYVSVAIKHETKCVLRLNIVGYTGKRRRQSMAVEFISLVVNVKVKNKQDTDHVVLDVIIVSVIAMTSKPILNDVRCLVAGSHVLAVCTLLCHSDLAVCTSLCHSDLSS